MIVARLALPSPDAKLRPPAIGSGVFARVEGEEAHLMDEAPWLGGSPTGEVVSLPRQTLLAPVAPSKIVCVGRNYAAHAKELGNEVPAEPLLFLKPPSSLIGPGASIVLPPESARVEHEVELGVIIGRRAKGVAPEAALAHVFGYTCAGDITARDLQRSDGQWTRAKGFDTFCPAGPYVVTELDPHDLPIRCRVDGETRQDGRTSQMVFSVAELVAYASRVMTLEPGDLLLTGTPSGVGPLHPGSRIEMEIDGVGLLACDVRAP